MKKKKNLLTFAIVGCMAILLCMPAVVFTGGSPNPGVPAGLKVANPGVNGVLMIGWKYTHTISPGNDEGTVEAFLKVDDKIYTEIKKENNPESAFIAADVSEITGYKMPNQLVLDFEMGDPGLGAYATILEENDVSNFRNQNVEISYIRYGYESAPMAIGNFVIGETSTAVAQVVQDDTPNYQLIVDNVVGDFVYGETLLESYSPNYLNGNGCSLTGEKVESIEGLIKSAYRHIIFCDVKISFLVPKK
jgi:hypothetical protein